MTTAIIKVGGKEYLAESDGYPEGLGEMLLGVSTPEEFKKEFGGEFGSTEFCCGYTNYTYILKNNEWYVYKDFPTEAKLVRDVLKGTAYI